MGIQVAVDVNPHLQGRYTAVTGHQVVALEFLLEYRWDFVVITNPVYVEEIRVCSPGCSSLGTPMIFAETRLTGAFVIDLDPKTDLRGYVARTFCVHELQSHGLNPRIVQCNVSFNKRQGTLRGMHWQIPPYAEAKLVRVIRGGIHDVIVDLRPGSPTYLQHIAVELTSVNGRMLYIPEGFAHGFQTLEDNTEVFYQMSEFYTPEYGRGARWNDPAFAIPWPLPNPIMSDRDKAWSDFSP